MSTGYVTLESTITFSPTLTLQDLHSRSDPALKVFADYTFKEVSLKESPNDIFDSAANKILIQVSN